MLCELRIKNIALIENLELVFNSGLTVFTGETGAGKSILVGAIGLLLGERADKDIIRSGSEDASVHGIFSLSDDHSGLTAYLESNDIPLEDGSIIISRHLSKGGRNRIYINRVPVTLSVLKEVGNHLIDLHGQHDHQSLLNPGTAGLLINNLPEVKPAYTGYSTTYQSYCNSLNELDVLTARLAALEEKRDLLTYQINEISSSNLQSDEEVSCETEIKSISSSAERGKHASAISSLISDESGITSLLASLKNSIQSLSKIDPSFSEWNEEVGSVQSITGELERAISGYIDTIDENIDPRQLDNLNSRLSLIQKLKKKYRCDFQGLFDLQSSLEADLASLESSGQEKERLTAEAVKLLSQTLKKGKALSASRKKALKVFDSEVTALLNKLGFTGAVWSTKLDPLQDPGSSGLETIEFMVSTNPGEPSLPLRKCASGGEISRLMLAIKAIAADRDMVPVLIFDEIDAGIGGITATEVAKTLSTLSSSHQVVCISHLHQIASAADNHFQVLKTTDGSRTLTPAKEVTGEDKAGEISRMLGSDSDAATRHARELIKK